MNSTLPALVALVPLVLSGCIPVAAREDANAPSPATDPDAPGATDPVPVAGDAEDAPAGGFPAPTPGTGNHASLSPDCTLKGFKLFGKIQVVDAFPDLKVQVVDAFPGLP